MNWTEIVRELRSEIDLGDSLCDGYVTAISSSGTAQISSQIDKLLTFIQSKEITKVILYTGINDTRHVCSQTEDIDSLATTMLERYETGINRLLAADLAPQNLLVVEVFDWNYFNECDNEVQSAQLANNINSGLNQLATDLNFQITDFEEPFDTEIEPYFINEWNYNIGGHLFTWDYACDDETICMVTADDHFSTVTNGILANALFVDFLEIERFSDAEILSNVGLTPQ